MSWELVLLLFFATVITLLLTGCPVSLAFLITSIGAAFIYWRGEIGIIQLSLTALNGIKSWSLLPIPLFIFLGELLFSSGIASRAINVVDMWMGRIPGRLSIVAVISSVLMGTFTGSSLASGAMLASSLYPEMEKRGYHPVMTLGPIAGCAGLAMLIPPSTLAVFMATVTQISVADLLIGGIVPGIIMGVGYIGYIVIRAKMQPSLAPPYEPPKQPLKTKLKRTFIDVVPLALIITAVSGVILLGIATPSEAAASGALAGILVTCAYRAISWDKIKQALKNTIKTSCMLFTIILGSSAFGQLLAYSGATKALVSFVCGLTVPTGLIIFLMCVIIFIMGCFMEVNSIILITIPIFMPIVRALGFSDVAFCLAFMMLCEMAESSPPFGVQLFMLKGMFPKLPMKTIISAGWPYLISDAVAVLFVLIFPQVVLWLPNLLKQ